MTKFIADACCNHLGSDLIIKRMMEIAKLNGVKYLKFQLYDTNIINRGYKEHSQDYVDFMRQCEIDGDKLNSIVSNSIEIGVEVMFTIFHPNRLELLKQYSVKFPLKIASCNASCPWVEEVIDFNSPELVIISTGMSDEAEKKALIAKYYDDKRVKFLSCVSMYPSLLRDINFTEVKMFDGLSCHTNDIKALKQIILYEPEFLEFHFTLGNFLPGPDQKFSVDPCLLDYINRYRRYLKDVKRYKERFIEPIEPIET
jgi:sialic acid synthase SpsE